jgi:2-oxoglutarate-Fe(II)-dependent oxygenase superfamily protein
VVSTQLKAVAPSPVPRATVDTIAAPTTTTSVNGRILMVFDDIFMPRQIEHFADIVGRLEFTRRPSFDRELSFAIDRDAFIRAPFLFDTTERLLARHAEAFGTNTARTRLSHVYAAAMTATNRPRPHRDHDDDDSVTFLYYANARWPSRWGGETVFYASPRRPCAKVTPAPGRLAMFHSNILHRGGAPHRDAPTFRFTISVFYYPPE